MKKLHFFFLFFLVIDSHSHEFNPAHLIVNQSAETKNNYEATWMYPVKNIGKRAEVIFPEKCSLEKKEPYIQGKYIIEKISLDCDESLKGKSIEIKDLMGDNNHYSAVIKSSKFNNLSKIEQHKLVYKSLKGKMGNELHAFTITTEGK